LTVSIVSHGQAHVVRPLLGELKGLASTTPIQLLVTENLPGSPGALGAEEVLGLGAVYLENRTPMGFGANHNRAFSHCTTPYFCVMNPDIRLGANPFPGLLNVLRNRPGLVAPRVESPDGTVEDSVRRVPTVLRLARRAYFRLRRRRLAPDYPVDGDVAVDWAAGMFLVFDAKVFRALGGFDESFHLYCEDVDICLRAWQAGGVVTRVGKVAVCHDARRDSHRRLRYLAWHLESMARLLCSKTYWKFLLGRHGSGITSGV
jgi:GT2 family glycosyltransferase